MGSFILGSHGPISYTRLKVVKMSLKTKIPVNPVEGFFFSIEENLNVDLFRTKSE